MAERQKRHGVEGRWFDTLQENCVFFGCDSTGAGGEIDGVVL